VPGTSLVCVLCSRCCAPGTIDVPTRGDLYLCGRRITSQTTDYDLAHVRLVELGFVFQTFNLLPSMTATENVEMPMVLAGVSAAKRKARARTLLKRVGMDHRMDHRPAQLSGGEQQRVRACIPFASVGWPLCSPNCLPRCAGDHCTCLVE